MGSQVDMQQLNLRAYIWPIELCIYKLGFGLGLGFADQESANHDGVAAPCHVLKVRVKHRCFWSFLQSNTPAFFWV